MKQYKEKYMSDQNDATDAEIAHSLKEIEEQIV